MNKLYYHDKVFPIERQGNVLPWQTSSKIDQSATYMLTEIDCHYINIVMTSSGTGYKFRREISLTLNDFEKVVADQLKLFTMDDEVPRDPIISRELIYLASRTEYSGRTRSILWLLTLWLFTSPAVMVMFE